MEKPAFYFDVEIKKRELLSRTLLAASLAERGCHAIVGPRATAGELGQVVSSAAVVRKSISPNEIGVMEGLKADGHGCIAMDEEGLLVDQLERFAAVRHSPATVDAADLILLWGPAQAEFLRGFYASPAKFQSAGNPRVVLWANRYFGYFDDAVREINARYGSFTLVPSNFAVHTNRALCERTLGDTGYLDSESNRATHLEHAGRVDFIFERFVELVRALGARGEQVVFRPHPSDNVDYLRARFAGCDNVHVIGSGDIAPWILAARNLVHNCCTTAVESAFMGTRIVSYCPDGVAQYKLDSVNRLGIIAHTQDDVLSVLERTECAIDPQARSVGGFLDPDASLDAMGDLLLRAGRSGRLRPGLRGPSFYRWQSMAMASARKVKDAFVPGAAARAERRTFRGKFPPTYPGEIDRFLACLSARGVVKRNLRARMVGGNTFYLEA